MPAQEVEVQERDRMSPSFPSSEGSRGSRDHLYRHRSRTPSSEFYSTSSRQDKLEKSNNKREKRHSYHTIGNDAMSKALQQKFLSLLLLEGLTRKLPYRFS